MSSTALYLIGYIVFTLGIAYAAHLLGLSMEWVLAIIIIFTGLGILRAVTRTRRREPPVEK